VSVHESTQSGSRDPQLDECTPHASDCLRDRHDVSGLTLSDADLMDILGLKRSAFGLRKKAGYYKRFLCRPQIGNRTQYSGTLVQKWRDGFGKDDRLGVGRLERKAGEPQGGSLRLVKNAAGRSR
jgi:hypothetical protein